MGKDLISATDAASATQPEAAPPSLAVVEAVAEETGVSALELSPPLQTVVDLDALDKLAGTPAAERASTRISFTYGEYEVTVHGDGTVDVSDAA